MVKKLLAKGRSTGFFTLVAGTGVAQAIPIAFAPILTRLYTPEDFGVAALYLSFASILGIVATLRYEVAILQPEDDEVAFKLVKLCVWISVTLATVLFVTLFLWLESISTWLGVGQLGELLFFLPLSMFLAAIFQAYQYWSIRMNKYNNVAIANTVQASVTPGTQVALVGMINLAGVGLVVGNVIGQAVASLFLSMQGRKAFSCVRKDARTAKGYKTIAKKYKKMPLFGLPGALLDTTAVQLPVIVMTKMFDSTVVGFYSLVFRVLSIPARLISGALSQLLLKRLSRMASNTERVEESLPLVINVSLALTLCVSPLVLVMQLWGEEFFSFVFGEGWRDAGSMAAVLVFAVAIRFIVSPLSAVLALADHIRKGFYWQCLYFVTLSLTLFFAVSLPFNQFLLCFVVHEVVLYSIYMSVIYFACYQMDREIV